jgi:hypothetical protein
MPDHAATKKQTGFGPHFLRGMKPETSNFLFSPYVVFGHGHQGRKANQGRCLIQKADRFWSAPPQMEEARNIQFPILELDSERQWSAVISRAHLR